MQNDHMRIDTVDLMKIPIIFSKILYSVIRATPLLASG